ncbi:MAG: RNA polymerase sigma factor [Ruminococcaceae bacterium]|nr:RNA polymerase sigma factor [Oscillospiraceae bacterium]
MDNGASSYRRFLDGDDEGVVEIIRDYKDGLIFFIRGFVSDINTAEDLAEDTFVKLVTKKPHFRGGSSFKTWLYAIGRNIAIDYLKKNSRINNISVYDCRSISDDEADLERAYLREEGKILFHRALNRLKPEYRQILWLTYFEGITVKEAARLMKKKPHNIEVLVWRAKKALRSELEKEGFTYEGL